MENVHETVAPSVIWDALVHEWGEGVWLWEAETLQTELERRGVAWTPALAAKVLGGQTVKVCRDWTFDYDVFFAFALACDGIPADAEAYHHPTVVQMAWAVREIQRITKEEVTLDHGFDPDTVDPAIAAVLHDDGWVVAPRDLRFAQEALDRLNLGGGGVKPYDVLERWVKLEPLSDEMLSRAVSQAPESALTVQLTHLADCELELRARERLLATWKTFRV